MIRHEATADEMRWSRWSTWRPGDRRWRVHVIDTSSLPVEAVARELTRWINAERALFVAGAHPLAGPTASDESEE